MGASNESLEAAAAALSVPSDSRSFAARWPHRGVLPAAVPQFRVNAGNRLKTL